MNFSDPTAAGAAAAVDLARPAVTTALTVYGCGPDEADLFQALAPRLGVTPTLTEAAPCEATSALAAGNRCVSVGHKTRISDGTLRALSRVGVRYISTRSIGVNHIDVAYAASLGIRVGNVAYCPDGVADYTLMLMLMALRDARSILSRAEARDYRLNPTRGRELRDLTVGVVGTGRIGAAVVDRLRGFGCRVLTHDARPGQAADYMVDRVAAPVALDELLRRSDLVTLHTPLTPDTHHLLDHRRIARMKPGAIVVNTGRGALIDTSALIQALERGALGGAALDVLEGEEGVFYADCRHSPADGGFLGRLRRLPNVLISPHTAYYTESALRDAVENSLINCLRFESEVAHG